MKRVDTEKNGLSLLINVKELSRHLSGNDTSIRRKKCPIMYLGAVRALEKAVSEWMKNNPKTELAEMTIEERIRVRKEANRRRMEEKSAKKISQAKSVTLEVLEEDKKGEFKDCKPKIPNIKQNGKCYKFWKWKAGGSVLEHYFYSLTEAIEFSKNQ